MAKRNTVGIRVLKNQLSTYVRSVSERGEQVVITDRGRPVARLVPERGPPSARERMRIRPAVLDLSDLSWMKPRRDKRERRASDADIHDALELTRADKDLV